MYAARQGISKRGGARARAYTSKKIKECRNNNARSKCRQKHCDDGMRN